jgi:hypothetical protein
MAKYTTAKSPSPLPSDTRSLSVLTAPREQFCYLSRGLEYGQTSFIFQKISNLKLLLQLISTVTLIFKNIEE